MAEVAAYRPVEGSKLFDVLGARSPPLILLMHSLHCGSLKKALAMIVATSAILASSVREAAPGRQPDSSRPLRLEDLVLLEEVHGWFEPTGSDTAVAPVGVPLLESVRVHRESFEFFVGIADLDAVGIRLEQVPFGARILEAADRHGLDPLLVAAVAEVESGFDVQAMSPRGALGLMQVMPETARQLGVYDLNDPGGNLEAGTSYLASLLRRFDGDVALALAGYNAGPTAVGRFGGLPPFPETRRFTERVLRLYVEHHRAVWIAGGGQHEPLFPIVGRGADPTPPPRPSCPGCRETRAHDRGHATRPPA